MYAKIKLLSERPSTGSVIFDIKEAILISTILLFLYLRPSDEVGVNNQQSQGFFVNILASYGLYIALIALFALVIYQLQKSKKMRPGAMSAFYIFSLFIYSIRIFSSTSLLKSGAGILVVIFLAIFACPYKYPHMQTSYRATFRVALNIFFPLFLASSLYLYQAGIGFFGFRFAGLSYHPNQFGLISAFSAIFYFVEMKRKGGTYMSKIMCTLLLVSSLLFLIASGSRGALISAVVGICYALIKSNKRLPAISCLLGICAITPIIYSSMNIQADDLLRRYTDVGDNRTEVFDTLFEGFLKAPLFGLGENAVGSENSYLKSLAIGGIFCGIPLLSFALLALLKILRQKLKQADVFFLEGGAVVGASLMASLFDGYLFEKFGFTAFLIFGIVSGWPKKVVAANSNYQNYEQKNFLYHPNS